MYDKCMKDLSNENVIQLDKNGLSYLQFKKLSEYPEIYHLFSLKPADIAALSTWEEKKESAMADVRNMQMILDAEDADVCRPCQTHSDHIKTVEAEDAGIYDASFEDTDGLVTGLPGKFLLLGFGDCTPLLFYDPVHAAVGNIHSGWRGTCQRIGAKAVKAMEDAFGSKPADLICCIAPHIRKCHFEVDEDVYLLFRNAFTDFADFEKYVRFEPERNKYYIDTTALNIRMLENAGLKPENIIDSGICTVCHSDMVHSYRADKAASGRSAAVIGLKMKP